MSQGERRVADVTGRYAMVIKNDQPLDDATWAAGRILLSNRRLVLASKDGKQTIPLSELSRPGRRFDVNQSIASTADYLSLRHGDDVMLISTANSVEFDRKLFSALLDGRVVLARHPAVMGGVVQDATWEKAKIKLGDDELNVATVNGSFFSVELSDVSSVESNERTVLEDTKRVVEVGHTEEMASVQTYFSGDGRICSILTSLFDSGMQENDSEISLDASEEEVLMALHSGVSPFEIPAMMGRDVLEIEETFEQLIELDVLEEVCKRRDVILTPRGRNLANGAMNDR